jgi:hypothetical protein
MVIGIVIGEHRHRKEMNVLADRCYFLLQILREGCHLQEESLVAQAAGRVERFLCREVSIHRSDYLGHYRTLQVIQMKMQEWDRMKRIEKVVMAKRVEKEIGDCHAEIETCLQELNVRHP